MLNATTRAAFLKQLEAIVTGVKQTKAKVHARCADERAKRDGLNAQLQCLVEQQRKYATAVKEFTAECRRNAELVARLRALSSAAEAEAEAAE